MRCKFCGLETKSAICEYCGYDNIHGDAYDTGTVTGSNYQEPTLNTNHYGSETTEEHTAHAPYEEPQWDSASAAQDAAAYDQESFQQFDSSFPDPDASDYRNAFHYDNRAASGEAGGNGSS